MSSTDDSITLSLWSWCNEALINGTTKAFFGKKIFEINPNLLESNIVWERTSWKYMYKLPRFLANDMYTAKDEIVDTLRKYFDSPKEERDDALYFVTSVEDELRACNLDNGEIARILMLHHWAYASFQFLNFQRILLTGNSITGNVYKVTFWMVTHLIHNPALLALILKEIEPARDRDQFNGKYLIEKCPRLEALFNEVLRVCLASALARQVIGPTVIGGRVLHKGTKIIVREREFVTRVLLLTLSATGPISTASPLP